MRLDWQLFNVEPEDQQLVDLVVSYGEPFPKKDADGNVITQVTTTPGTATHTLSRPEAIVWSYLNSLT